MINPRRYICFVIILIGSLLFSACLPETQITEEPTEPAATEAAIQPAALKSASGQAAPRPVPFPTRPPYSPGELVDYTAQTGDTLPALAAHFNTTVAEILAANTFIPQTATTMPPGMPMKIPIYYLPLWGNPYQILPDSLFVNGPAQVGFNTQEFVDQHPGWLKSYHEWASDADRSGAELVDLIAENYSLSPRLLLALLEFWGHALTEPAVPAGVETYPLGYVESNHRGVYLQLIWTANTLNNGYYRWRLGQLPSFDLKDGSLERLDPWQNATTASLHYYFSLLLSPDSYARAISADGLAAVYKNLFGDPWQNVQAHIPGSLEQPGFRLPFTPGKRWAFTGGPHTGWGVGEPFSAIDFAPPSNASGCVPTDEWVTAVADGVVVRSEDAIVVLDLDGDGDLRTGWEIFYLHMATDGRIARGARVKAGDPLGHPSCEGGEATGTHVHMARLYNGEWIPAGGIQGILAYNLEGWVAQAGSQAYEGTLRRYSQTITACTCSDANSQLASEGKP